MKCKICGEEFDSSHYYKDIENAMNKHQMCFDCNFWREKVEQDAQQPPYKVAIINGTHYYIDDENVVSEFRGFGGARFQIEFNDGTRVVTTNLWCQGDIPPQWRDKFPDNARFEKNLKWVQIGQTKHLVEVEVK